MMAEEMASLGPDKGAAMLRQWASLASSGAEQFKVGD